jgi:hypothetical protein
MPSIDAPSYYEHAKTQAAGRADAFLKWLDENEYLAVTGEVDCPLGWVGLIEITGPEIATWVSSQGDPWMSEKRNFETGWYIVKIDNNGLVWGLYYGQGTLAEEGARADFAEAEATYELWLGINER